MAMSMEAICWLVALVLFVIVEGATTGLTTIWFAAGALVGCVLAVFGVNVWIQLGAFLGVSALLLAALRPLAAKLTKKDHEKTNAESLIGDLAIVTETIDNLSGNGQVQIRGQYWTARAKNDVQILKGKKVRILEIHGVKLIVEEES